MYKIARVGLHHFEEPCLSGERGSGTIFFSGCNLRCLFCQNYEISHGGKGLEVSESEFVDCMLYLQDIGAHNINLVTPSNYTNLLQSTLEKAKPIVKLPIVWNSSGYETVANLKKWMDSLTCICPISSIAMTIWRGSIHMRKDIGKWLSPRLKRCAANSQMTCLTMTE